MAIKVALCIIGFLVIATAVGKGLQGRHKHYPAVEECEDD